MHQGSFIQRTLFIPLMLLLLIATNVCFVSKAYGYFFINSPYRYSQHQSLWRQLRYSFSLNDQCSNYYVRHQIEWFLQHRGFLYSVAVASKPYLHYVYSQVEKRHLPTELALLPMIESAYNPFAYSRQGAAGLWQIMPGTGSGFGLKQDWWYDGRRDVFASTRAALDYFTYLDHVFKGNWLLAIAAYNSGEGTLLNSVHYNIKHRRRTEFWYLRLPRETRNYVPRLLALACILKHPREYPVSLPRVKNQPYLTQIDVGHQINLAYAAKLAHMNLLELYRLNPGYNHWITDPKGPNKLVIPISKVELFKKNLAQAEKQQREWFQYRVAKGDTLAKLAVRNHTSIAMIKHVNKLPSNQINIGQTLTIPRHGNNTKNTQGKIPNPGFLKHHQPTHSQRIVHIARNNESLRDVARVYGVKVWQLRHWNHLSKHYHLHNGKALVLWRLVPNIAYTYGKQHVLTHKVKKGESLWTIAKHYKVSVKKLRRWNKMSAHQRLHRHQILKIYLS